MTDEKVYKSSYEVEVEYLDRDEDGICRKGTVEIPYMSSEQFFDILGELGDIADGAEIGGSVVLKLATKIINKVYPGLLSQITPISAVKMLEVVFDREKDSLGYSEDAATKKSKKPTASMKRKS